MLPDDCNTQNMRALAFLSSLLLPFVDGVVRGISLYGLETPLKNTDCSWKHPANYYIDKLASLGFNYLRVPFSQEYVRQGDFHIMDEVFDSCHQHNMSILLDLHRTWDSHQGDWYETNMHDFLQTWTSIIQRYYHDDTLQAVGLYNEYQGSDSGFWNAIMREATTRLENQFPDRVYYLVGCPNWSSWCQQMNLEDLPFAKRIRYEAHYYHFSSVNSEAAWDQAMPFPHKTIIGEWGFRVPEDIEWGRRFVSYLKSRGIRDTFFWTLCNSQDTGGIYQQDCETLEQYKVDLIHDLWTQGGRKLSEDDNTTTTVEVADWPSKQLRRGKPPPVHCRQYRDPTSCISHDICAWNNHYHCWRCIGD